MKKQNKFISWIKSPASDFWLFVAVLVLANLVASRAFFRIDLTGAHSYSLSESSREVVSSLEEPLGIKVFFSSNLPAPYSGVQQYVNDILGEYKNAANSNFSCEYFDMNKSENQTLARNYGLNQIQIREVKDNELGFKNAYMGLAITYADQIETLDSVTSSDGLEYKITTTIGRLISNTNALSGLSDKVTLTLYKTEALSSFGIGGFSEIDSAVKKAWESVNGRYRGKIEFASVNPDSQTAQELSSKYGIQSVSWQDDSGKTQTGSIGLVLECADKFRVVPLKMQNMIFQYVITGLDSLEQNISDSVQALVAKTAPIAYITGHGELSLDDAQNGAAPFKSLLGDIYSLEELALAESEIPAGVSTIIINGPKSSFSDDELYKIDQFVMRGGNVMFFMDSYNVVMPSGQNAYYQQPQYIPVRTGLEKLLSAYGVETGTGYVMDENCFTQNHQQYGKLNFYYVPMLQKSGLDQKNLISKNLGYVLFMQSSAVDATKALENPSLNVSVLAKSSPESWIQSDNLILSPLYIQPPADKSKMKSENLAVLVEGKFTSAYSANPSAENEGGSKISTSSHISEGTQRGKIFVAGTSYITSGQLISSDGADEPVAMFVRNAVDYMNGNSDFCSMRTKNVSLNTLRVSSGPAVSFAKFFNQFGLAILVVLSGLVVILVRRSHREKIRLLYNPDDSRQIVHNKNVEK